MSTKTKITAIGDYLEALELPLREKNILLECIINGCSPLAMAGSRDNENLKYCDDINMPMPTLLNIRKNLFEMLSRNVESFNQNYNIQPYGSEVRYKNETEYIIVMNTSMGYAVFEKDGIIFSDSYSEDQFNTFLKTNKQLNKHVFPFPDNFNWKSYYDNFIDCILDEYDSNHIILIKTNSAQWYMDSQNICNFENKSSAFRNMIELMDEYFLERTHCLCINDQYNFIPDKKEPCAFMYSSKSSAFNKCIEKTIETVVKGDVNQIRCDFPAYCNPLVKTLYLRLSREVFENNSDIIDYIEKNRLYFNEIEGKNLALKNDFIKDIIRLKRFLDKERFTLSDYAIDLLEGMQNIEELIDIQLLELYTKYFKLDINDIIAVYMLYSQCENKECFRTIVSNIISNSDCMPIIAEKKFRRKNIEYLQNYPYIQNELREIGETEKIFVRLENDSYILIDPLSDNFLEKVDLKIDKTADFMKVIDNGYICPIESADALSSSYAFYIEKAKRGDGNRPVKIEFNKNADFCDTISYIDYEDILENEHFVISMAKAQFDISEYKAVCDLSFLFKKNTRIFVIYAGLTDQICHYIFSKRFEEANQSALPNSKPEIFYDDTCYLYNAYTNGSEVCRFTEHDISDRLITNLLSPKLRKQISNDSKFPDLLAKNGCDEATVVSRDALRVDRFNNCNKILIPNVKLTEFMKMKFDLTPLFYHTFIRPEIFWLYYEKYDINKYIIFPKFDDINQLIANKMLSCDAVAIHVRLGDFVRIGWDVDSDYYIESIKKLLNIPDYENKKYFVFSDNIPYVKKHCERYGLDLLGDSEIFFVDHNKDEESYRDMQLMTLAKVIIASGSGMARMAAVMSSRCEQYFSWRTKVLDLFESVGKKNKYEIGLYSRNYYIDYSQIYDPKSTGK